jgi:hypothetical protein
MTLLALLSAGVNTELVLDECGLAGLSLLIITPNFIQ